MSLYSIQATLILDIEGNRILAKYYTPPANRAAVSELASQPLAEQLSFEHRLVDQIKDRRGDVILFRNHLIVYVRLADSLMCLLAPVDENEIMIFQALTTLRDAVDSLLSQNVDRTSLIKNYDILALAVDEVVDNGVILQTESRIVATCARRPKEDTGESFNIHIDVDRAVKSYFDFAKGKLAEAVRHQLR